MARSLYESPVLAIGDGINRNVECIKANGVLRALFVEAVSHGETACGNKHHRGAILFVDNDRRKLTSGRTECKCSLFGKDFVICWRIHSAL